MFENIDLKIERPKVNDLQEIHQLFSITVNNNFKQEALSDQSGSLQESIVEGLVKLLKQDFKSQGKKEFHLIAKSQDLIIGIIAFGKPNPIILEHLNFDSAKTPEIKSVYVLPDFQNKGIGNLLLGNILKCLRKRNYGAFCLDSGYINAQRYWTRKLGAPTRILDQYWTPKNHHMIWQVNMEDNKALSKLLNK